MKKSIRELMTRDVVTLKPEHTIQDAAKLMLDLNVGVIPVCVQNNHLQGMITDRDIVVRAVSKGMNGQTKIGDCMSGKVVTIEERSNSEEALQLMAEHQIRRLPVVDDQNRMVGIVSIGDLAEEGPLEDEAGVALHEISYPARPLGEAQV
ncbi:CBS domain-containing protein [Tumebacillus sp. DT12]|uniref:CBS domain-containing protein n=1 Tax=Tumebacillus lacus TaxID=2995335 RepID=A0ABT3X1A3_9BACL|nr:CBS domain-containing protein [Tumebacillus lacus]MCX7570699.1 CBS domain-containing protein [Tumebacillus lacus]